MTEFRTDSPYKMKFTYYDAETEKEIPAPVLKTSNPYEHSTRFYGVAPPRPERHRLHAPRLAVPDVPVFDNRIPVGTAFDQGEEGSCFGHAASKYREGAHFLKTAERLLFSRRYPYTVAKIRDDDPKYGGMDRTDYKVQQGTTLSAGSWAARRCGFVLSEDWPYVAGEIDNDEMEDVQRKAQLARPWRIKRYFDLTRGRNAKTPQDVLNNIKRAIFDTGSCVVGLAITYAWLTVPPSGIVKEEAGPMGGHAVCLCGWDDNVKRLFGINSWGTSFGDNGFFYYPYKYILEGHLIGAERWEA